MTLSPLSRAMEFLRAADSRQFFREFLTGIGEPKASLRRLRVVAWFRLLVGVPIVFVPTLIWLRSNIGGSYDVTTARMVLNIWLVQTAAYVPLNIGVIWATGRDHARLARYLSFMCMFIEIGTNQVSNYCFGILLGRALIYMIALIAVYRVVFDYSFSLAAAIFGITTYYFIGVAETSGIIPLSPGLPYPFPYATYHLASSSFAIILGSLPVMFVVFVAVNYGANRLFKKNRDLKTRQQEIEMAQEELQDAYQKLAEYDRLKSRFFANVSHEFRTPLTLILTPLEQMIASQQNNLPMEIRRKHLSMSQNTQRLLRLVNQLLDFSKIEGGVDRISYEKWNLEDLLDPIVEGFEAFCRTKRIELQLNRSGELPAVYIDPVILDKVLCNLLANACKFTDANGSIVVGLDRKDRCISISVQDTGIGIPKEDLPQLFDRFYQVDGSASRNYEGTGLGLALSKELIELMGGSIEVESDSRIGSTFTVNVPLGKQHIAERSTISQQTSEKKVESRAEATAAALVAEVGLRDQTPSMNPGGSSGQPVAGIENGEIKGALPTGASQISAGDQGQNKPLVLVVEDNADMRSLIKEICCSDFRIAEASDGAEGLSFIQRQRPDLVISDVMMPILDGYGLLNRIRANESTAEIPVMLLTAKASMNMKLEGLEGGADDYLAKPFEARELVARARNLVRIQEQARKLRELNTHLQAEVIKQATELGRARSLGQYLPEKVAKRILEQGQPAQVAQRRVRITAFRMELRGIEHLLENADTQDIAAVLNSYLSTMTKVAFEHGATVDKFIRDTIVGFFGAPDSEGVQEDALLCWKMAIDLWQEAKEICERWRGFLDCEPPRPTVVLSSGYAIVGSFGSESRLDYTAVGGPVEETLALIPHVGAGDVACSQSTWSLIEAEQGGKCLKKISVRHRSNPMNLFRLSGYANVTESKINHAAPAAIEQIREFPDLNIPITKLEPGMNLTDRYEVVRRLGEGGMGAVYQIKDRKLSIDAALKIVRNDKDDSSLRIQRLYREVKLARLVSHENVARIFDLGEWRGNEFITMEFIDGLTLEQHLELHSKVEVEEGQRILRGICHGVSAAHAAGVIHRDLKPSNIMLETTGRVVVLDFGIAKWATQKGPSMKETAGCVGTPYYMSPEQFLEEELDTRTDIYSLGVLSYEMFTGQRPFSADNVYSLALQHTRDLPPNPLEIRKDLPPRLAAVIMRCLEKNSQDRFESAREIMGVLQ